MCCLVCVFFFFFKQKTAYEMRISDWSSDVCSSDLKAIIFSRLVTRNTTWSIFWIVSMSALKSLYARKLLAFHPLQKRAACGRHKAEIFRDTGMIECCYCVPASSD